MRIIDQDFTNKQFNNLIAIRRDPNNKVKWICRCICKNKNPNEVSITCYSLNSGHTKSCGCLKQVPAGWNLSEDPYMSSVENIFKSHYSDGNLTLDKFLELSQQDCMYCARSSQDSNCYNPYKNSILLKDNLPQPFLYNGLDRIDNNKKHDLDNVYPCCKHCNTAKMEMTLENFVNWAVLVYKNLNSEI